jgi:tetratricopeptide (TPR) repeat protein
VRAAVLLFAICCAFPARPSLAASPFPDAARPFVQQAKSLQDQGLLPQALDAARKAVAAAPSDVDIHRIYSDLMVALGQRQALVAEYAARMEREPASPAWPYLLGRAVGEPERSGQLFHKSLSLDRKYPWALQGLGSIALAEGRPKDAIDLLRAAAAVQPDRAEVWNKIAAACLAVPDESCALTAWAEARKVEPDDHQAWLNEGAIRVRKGELPAGITLLEEATKRAPGHPLAHVNLAYALWKAGRHGDAVGHFDVALAINPRDRLVAASRQVADGIDKGRYPKTAFPPLEEALRAEMETGDAKLALQKWKELATLVPDLVAAWLRIGLLHAELGDADSARAALKKAVSIAPDDIAARYNLGYLLLGLDAAEEAAPHLQRAYELDGKDVDNVVGLALLALARGDGESALRRYHEALKLRPDDPVLLVQLGTTQAASGDFRAGEASFRKALSLAPEFIEARTQLVALLREDRRYDAALKELAELEKLAPGNADIATERGKLEAARRAVDAGRKDGAIRLAQILVADKATADAAVAELKGGTSWDIVARRRGTGPEAARAGDLGWVDPAELRAELATAVRALKPGQTSAALPVGSAYVILRRSAE